MPDKSGIIPNIKSAKKEIINGTINSLRRETLFTRIAPITAPKATKLFKNISPNKSFFKFKLAST